jgi:hypothetical protein
MSFYEAVDVWRRMSADRSVRYRCFRSLSSGKYSVQSADFYQLPLNPQTILNLEKQFLELFTEEAPDSRSEGFETLQAAIEAHISEFGIDHIQP